MSDLFEGTPDRTVGLLVNAPAVFAREDFMTWLNDPENAVLSYHVKGQQAHEYSDAVVLVDSNYEGDSANMPEDVWKAICDLVYDQYGGPNLPLIDSHVHVRLTNLVA